MIVLRLGKKCAQKTTDIAYHEWLSSQSLGVGRVKNVQQIPKFSPMGSMNYANNEIFIITHNYIKATKRLFKKANA